ncbi:MAG: sigma-70 family RNA polymerase sigma factor [Planctomycetota bacterium]|nr:sigma-70 family RNA polymerase sigma factor [Planctomycetota bacterium]
MVSMAENWQTSMMGGPGPFPETSWSQIVRCQEEVNSAALEDLCRRYWRPVYFYVHRNWTRDVEQAKDLTQDFFATFLEKSYLDDVKGERGKFRSFVCASLRNFLLNQKRAALALKRNPEGGVFSLDGLRQEDARFDVPAPTHSDPMIQFDEDWREAVVDAAIVRLREVARKKGREVLVDCLVRYDLSREEEGRATYDELAEEFSLTTHQVRNGLHWVRKQFMELLREEMESQVSSREDYESEVTCLFGE